MSSRWWRGFFSVVLEFQDSLLKVLVIPGRNGQVTLLILELAELMEKPFSKGEQLTLHPQNGFPFFI
jgi:hypothetical protein